MDGKNFELGMYVRSSKKKVISVRVWGWLRKGWKRAEYGSHAEEIDEKCGYWRTHTISWPCVLRMHSAGMQTEWNNHYTVHDDVRVTYFWWNNRKITGMVKISKKVAWSYDMEGHAQTCVERYCELAWHTRSWSFFLQSFASLFGWMITNTNRRNWNQLESCQKFAHKLSCNACTWHELDDLISLCLSTSLQDQSQNGFRHVPND